MIFESESVDLIYAIRVASPAWFTMLCRTCSGQQLRGSAQTVSPGVIEAVARDFDLHESGSPDE